MKVLTNLDLNKNEIQNVRLQQLSADPSASELVSGMIWMNTSSSPYVVKYYNGSEVITLGALNFETSSSNIKMDGTASVGSLSTVARADHIHPSDTSRVPTTRTVNGHALSSNVVVTGEDLGFFYGVSETATGTAAKTVDITGFTSASLVNGVRVLVRFRNGAANSSNITLNVSSTGQRGVYDANDFIHDLKADQVAEFVLDTISFQNPVWRLIGISDTTYDAGTASQLEEGTSAVEYLWTPKVLHDYVTSSMSAVDAMRFKGTIGTGGNVTSLPTLGVKVGDTYRVITAGTYASQTCEVGDLIIATSTTPTWTVAQTNIDGAITSISSGTGVSVSGSGSSRTVSLASGVATAGSKGDTSNQTPSWGDTFKVTSETIDTYGRTTALDEHTVTIPSSTATSSANGLMSSTDKSDLNNCKTKLNEMQNVRVYQVKKVAADMAYSGGVYTWTITGFTSQNLNAYYSVIQVYDSSGNTVLADVERTDYDEAQIKFVSPTTLTGSFTAVIIGILGAITG